MPDNIETKVLIVGSGLMAVEYARVLDKLGIDYVVVGRGENSADCFENKIGHPVVRGGIEGYIKRGCFKNDQPIYAVNTVRADHLYEVSSLLLKNGVRYILSEKPGGMRKKELQTLKKLADLSGAEVYIGYNRRYYSSVKKAKKMIKEDGGVSSYSFEFTEWRHSFEHSGSKVSREELEHLFIGNSSHVVDLAFYLGGKPVEWRSFRSGDGVIDWHHNASMYSGAGVCENGVLFSYQANWRAPGRWGLEIMTEKHRYILRPLEKLQIQNIASVAIDVVEIDDEIDKEFKPGLFMEVSDFLYYRSNCLCTLEEQIENFDIYKVISGEEI